MARVKCISQRERTEDGMYKTGAWASGEVKNVPDDAAKKMLRHSDVYVAATAEEAPNAPEVVIEPPPKSDKIQETYDAIARMGKDAVKAFVRTNFNLPVDLRQPEAKLRAYAIQLTDQFGVA